MRFLGMVLAVLWAGASLAAAAESQAAPAAATASLDFANGLYARKMYEPAASEYAKFIASNPESPELSSARFRYADSFYFLRDYDRAVSEFQSFVEDFPSDSRVPVALLRLGIARYSLKDMPSAVRIFMKLSTDADDPTIKSASVYYLAKAYAARGKKEKSMDFFRQLVENHPASEYSSYGAVEAGDILVQDGKEEDALEAYGFAASKQEPAEMAREAKLKIAGILFKRKDYEGARDAYQRLFDSLDSAQASAGSDAAKRLEAMGGEALLGLFYCDYYLGDVETSERRLEASQALLLGGAQAPEIFFVTASLLADNGKADLAAARLEEVLANPKTGAALREKALIKKTTALSDAGKHQEALVEVKKLLEKNADSPRAYFEKAAILTELGQYKEALGDYGTVILKYPQSGYAEAALYRSAGVYLKAGDKKTALERLRAFANKYPEEPDAETALLQIVQIHLDSENFNEAESAATAFIQARADSPSLDVATYKKGMALAGLQKFKDAASLFSQIPDKFPSSKLIAESLYGAASSFQNAREIPSAIPLYERLLAAYPDHAVMPEVRQRLGYLYIQAGQFDKANAFYQDLLFTRTDAKIDPDGMFWLVRELLNRGDYQTLQKMLEALPGRFPDQNLTHEIFFFRGEAAMGLSQFKEAAAFYGQALQASPEGQYAAHAHLGAGIGFLQAGDVASAEKAFEQTLKFDQEAGVTVRARFEIANLRLRQGNLEEASKAFMLVAILYDDAKYTPASLYKAAECFSMLGKTNEAMKAWEELKTVYPKSEWASKPVPVKAETVHV